MKSKLAELVEWCENQMSAGGEQATAEAITDLCADK